MEQSLFTVDVNASEALTLLRNGEKRQRYAIANALNKTAKLIQAEERAKLFGKFTVRRRDFITRQAAVIKPFASAPQNRLEVKISVGQKPRLLLSQFESGAIRMPFKGSNVAIPVVGGARPTQQASVPEQLWIKELGLKKIRAKGSRRKSPTGHAAIEGALGTYVVSGVGIFQRRTAGVRSSRLLYAFKPSVVLDSRLKFVETAAAVTNRNFATLLQEQVTETFTHHFTELAIGTTEGAEG